MIKYELFSLIVLLCCIGFSSSSKILLTNLAEEPINIFWVDLEKGFIPQTSDPIPSNSKFEINSFYGHQFIIQWESKQPEDKSTSISFVHGEFDEDITIEANDDGSIKLIHVDILREILDEIKSSGEYCTRSKELDIEDDDDFLLCTSKELIPKRLEIKQKLGFLKRFQSQAAIKLRDYICADESMDTSMPLRSFIWNDNQRDVKVNVLLEEKAAKIYHIENFVRPEECDQMTNRAKDQFSGIVIGEDGETITSNDSLDRFVAVSPVWDDLSNPITTAYERVYAFMHANSQYNLSYDGQEPFSIIQYEPSDEYRPQCDGACDGSFHKIGGRVATVVLYCQVATRGGVTGFPKADIYVKPEAYDAVFFTYRDSEGKMDDGLTEHTSCPVIEGDKWVSVHSFRDGVSLTNDWTSFAADGGFYSHLDEKNEVQIDSDENNEVLIDSEEDKF